MQRRLLLSFHTLLFLVTTSILTSIFAQNLRNIHGGFPDKWNGYLYREAKCHGNGFPYWLDGYFLCQVSAAYGNADDPKGKKLTHMLDALGGVASFHINQGADIRISGSYYPSLPYKIWSYYGGDFNKSNIAWPALFSPWNATAEQLWSQVPKDPDMVPIHPNINFWKVGKNVLGATEAATWVGMDFDIPTLTYFKRFKFDETSEIFNDPSRSSIKPLGMPTHHRTDADGTIWGVASGFSPIESRMYQIVFTVSPMGKRKVEGVYEFGRYDLSRCAPNNQYTGDKSVLASYQHSITSTENHLIIPITSAIFNPCQLLRKPTGKKQQNDESSDEAGIEEPNFQMDVDPSVPLRFLIFHKRDKRFITRRPLESYPAMFISHQINAFERNKGLLVADMIGYDNLDMYNKYLFRSFLTSQIYPRSARILRFSLDLIKGTVSYSYLLPTEKVSAEFPQFNHEYEGRPYNYAYMVLYPFAGGSQILKMDLSDPTGRRNKFFSPGPNFALSEPWYAAKPGAVQEDDGVLLVRALNTNTNKGVLFCVDARSLSEIARVAAPISVPFGFHNRYFSKRELELPPGVPVQNIKEISGIETPPLPVIPLLPSQRPDHARTQLLSKMSLQTPYVTSKPFGSSGSAQDLPKTIKGNAGNQRQGGGPPSSSVNEKDNNSEVSARVYENTRLGICNWMRDIFERMGSRFCTEEAGRMVLEGDIMSSSPIDSAAYRTPLRNQ